MQVVCRGPGGRVGGLPESFGCVGHLSLALWRLQLESWIGMASSTTLRHPEGTTELLTQLERESGGLAQSVALSVAVPQQHEDCQHEEG